MTLVSIFFVLVFVQGTSAACLGKSICQDMWKRAVNNLIVGPELNVNIPQAGVQLFQVQNVPAAMAKRNHPEFVTFNALLQQYIWANNPNNPNQRRIRPNANAGQFNAATNNFLAEIVQQGGPIEEAYNYLRRKGLLPAVANLANFQATLQNTWFGHKGFRHTFVGDKWQYNTPTFSGFHSWFQFMSEQAAGRIANVNVPPNAFHANTEPPYMAMFQFHWNGYPKAHAGGGVGGSSMFVGTNPAFEIALFTVCFIEHPNRPCSCHIGRSTITVQTFDAVNQGGQANQICTGFPRNVEIEHRRCTFDNNFRTQCGPNGINQAQCTARGCCFDNAAPPNCFYPRDHKCQLSDPNDRRQCGPPNVGRNACENQHNCCFDDSVLAHVHCYKGNL